MKCSRDILYEISTTRYNEWGTDIIETLVTEGPHFLHPRYHVSLWIISWDISFPNHITHPKSTQTTKAAFNSLSKLVCTTYTLEIKRDSLPSRTITTTRNLTSSQWSSCCVSKEMRFVVHTSPFISIKPGSAQHAHHIRYPMQTQSRLTVQTVIILKLLNIWWLWLCSPRINDISTRRP